MATTFDRNTISRFFRLQSAGAKNVAPEPGAPPAALVAAVERLVGGDKSKALVLYCNGQYCQASRMISEQLVTAGFTNVRRYQLGIPMWRALNGPVEIELEGILRVYKIDQTAVFFDARTAADFAKVSLPGTHNVPADQLATDGLRKAPMPSNDFNTRIVLFGRDFAQARFRCVHDFGERTEGLEQRLGQRLDVALCFGREQHHLQQFVIAQGVRSGAMKALAQPLPMAVIVRRLGRLHLRFV